MYLNSVSSGFISFLRTRRRLGTATSCFELLSQSSSSISVVHFHAHTDVPTSPNHIPRSTHIDDSLLELRQLLQQISKSGFDKLDDAPVLFDKMLKQKSKYGFRKLDDALVLFDKMLKMQPLPNAIKFAQLLSELFTMKQYPVAVSLFRDMCILGLPVDTFTFTIVIDCCCHSNRLDYAFSLLGGVFKRGLVPNVVTYATLIRGLLSQHKPAEARLLFTNLIKWEELPPKRQTYRTMINGLCKTDHADMALWLFRFMQNSDYQPNTVTYTRIIDSLCKHGLVDDALNIHSEMIEKGILRNVRTYSPIIQVLIQVLCNLNRWEDVTMLLKQMKDEMNISPDVHTFTILVDAYSKSGKLDDAKRIIEIMNERGEYPDTVTYNTLIPAYCTQEQMDEALAVQNTMKSTETMPHCYTYNILLDAYCRQLKLDKAMDLYRYMACEGSRPTVVTHNILLRGLCGLGKPIIALAFFYKIQDQGHMLNIMIYHTMLSGLCKNKFVDKALSLFYLMRCNGLNPDGDTYKIIIRGCLWDKKYNEACKLVDEMVECGFVADATTTSLIRHLFFLEEQDPSLLAMHQKCLRLGIYEEIPGVHIPKLLHPGCSAENSIKLESYDDMYVPGST